MIKCIKASYFSAPLLDSQVLLMILNFPYFPPDVSRVFPDVC